MTKVVSPSALREAREQIEKAAAAKKCWPCGCLHGSLACIERVFPNRNLPDDLAAAMRDARERLQTVRYDCLGCSVCFPALAINALGEAGVDVEGGCPTGAVDMREGWPPLPGDYTVLRFRAPVAVCTLTNGDLARSIVREAGPELSLVGTLQTENLGIERVIRNVIANPNIRFLILCGEDSRQRIGHLPGQSFLALARSGLDDRSRIVGAQGKRPVLRNIPREAVEHFRRTVEVIDQVGVDDLAMVLDLARQCGRREVGAADPFPGGREITVLPARPPERMIPDPAGYFVVYVDRRRECLSVEHYRNDGLLDAVIEGRTAAELYTPAIEHGLLTRLDHAAYLGRELARAEASLVGGTEYTQDGAPAQRPSRHLRDRAGPCRVAARPVDVPSSPAAAAGSDATLTPRSGTTRCARRSRG